MEQEIVNGIACARDEAKITLIGVPDIPGVAAKVFGPLADASVSVDMIVQNVSQDGKSTDMTFTVGRIDVQRAIEALEAAGPDLTRESFLAALSDLKAVDLDGLQLTFGPGDNQGLDDVFLTRITSDGRFEAIVPAGSS